MRVPGPSTSDAGRIGWIALVAAALAVLLASGSRFSLAAFVRPIEDDLGVSRAFLSGAAAVTLVAYGLGQPLVARLALAIHPATVFTGGLALMAVGAVLTATVREPAVLYVSVGILPGLGFAAASLVPATALLAPVFPVRPGFALGVASAAIPAGQAVMLPLAVLLIPVLGWQAAYAILGIGALAVGLPGLVAARRVVPAARPSVAGVGRAPLLDGTFWVLALGFAVCGATDQFVALHLIPLAEDRGVPALVAAGGLSALTLVGIAGSLASGPLADGWSARATLVGVYGLRVLSLPLLSLLGGSADLLVLGAVALLFGASYIANTAPAARVLRERHGAREVTRAMGWLQLTHHLGGAAGVALGGASVGWTGGYGLAIAVATGLALVATTATAGLAARSRARPALAGA